MKIRDTKIITEIDELKTMATTHGGRRRRLFRPIKFGLWGFLAILIILSNCFERCYALPQAQGDVPEPTPNPITTTNTPVPSPTATVVSQTSSRGSPSV